MSKYTKGNMQVRCIIKKMLLSHLSPPKLLSTTSIIVDSTTSAKYVVTIIKKFIDAMENQGVKFDRDSIAMQVQFDLFPSYPFLIAVEAFSKEEVWEKLAQKGVV